MRRPVEFWLRVATCLLVILGYVGLMSTYRYGPGIMLVPAMIILLMPIGEALDRRGPSFRKLTSAVSFVYVVLLPLIVMVVNLLDAVTALLVYIQIYSMLHVKKERDYDYIILMSFFLLHAAVLLTPSPLIGIVFIAFVVTAVWALIVLEMYAAEARSDATATVDVLSVGEQVSLVHEHRQRFLDARFASWVGGATLAVLMMTGLLFFSSPRLEAGLFGAGGEEVFSTAIDPSVEFSESGTIVPDISAIMRVSFPKEEEGRYNGEMFWRVASLPRYTDTSWIQDPLRSTSGLTQPPPDFMRFVSRTTRQNLDGVRRLKNGQGRVIEQEIYLDSVPEEGIPSLPFPVSMEPTKGQKDVAFRWSRRFDFSVEMSQRNEKSLNYSVVSEVYDPSPRALRGASLDYSQAMNRRDYRVLTYHNLLPETLELLESITEDTDNPYDKALAIQFFLAGDEFSYTLNLPDLPEENAMDAFILDTRSGHCELYASAMALMLRAEGVPSRIVKGYRGGSWHEGDKVYTVTADTAHVWVESFFPGHGWVTFDPSPASLRLSRFTLSAFLRAMSKLTIKWKMMWYRNVVGFTPENSVSLFHDVTFGVFDFQGRERRSREGGTFLNSALGLLPIGAAFSAIFFAGLMGTRVLRRLRKASGPTLTREQLQAVQLRSALHKKLTRSGIDCRGKTVDELRVALREGSWESPEIAFGVLEAYNAVRFGNRPLPNDVFRHIRRALRQLRAT